MIYYLVKAVSRSPVNSNPLLDRDFPESLDRRQGGDRRRVLDTRIDIDLTNPNVGADKRHRDRRQFAATPAPHSAFMGLWK